MSAGDTFKAGKYYRAEVTLTARYADGDVWYNFAATCRPAVDGVYETLYRARSDANRTFRFTLTYAVSDKLTDKASHLYYEGDTKVAANYGQYLDATLTVAMGDDTTVYTLRQLEEMALEKGFEGVYSYQGLEDRTNYTLTGIPVYDLLKAAGLPASAADSSSVTIGGKALTLGDIRAAGYSYDTNGNELGRVQYILAYGVNGAPYTAAKGPLFLGAPAAASGSDNTAGFIPNVADITVVLATASTFDVAFSVENDTPGATVTVTDSYGNLVYDGPVGTVTLNQGETYSYTVTAPGYGEKTGKVSAAAKIAVTLLPLWSGKLTEPATDEDGNYLIYSVDEFMWFNHEATQVSNERSAEMMTKNIKLMADLDMSGTEGKYLPMGSLSQQNTLYLYVVNPDLPKYYGGGAYSGTFDGNCHTISNLTIDWENYYELELAWDGSVMAYIYRIDYMGGLFGQTIGATIKDVSLSGSITVLDRPAEVLADWYQLGGIVGFAQRSTTITGCHSDMDLTYVVYHDAGTLEGYSYGGYPENCDVYIGGIAGSASALSGTHNVFENCYATGDLAAEGVRSIRAGGILGATRNGTNTITKCYSSGVITATPLRLRGKRLCPHLCGRHSRRCGRGALQQRQHHSCQLFLRPEPLPDHRGELPQRLLPCEPCHRRRGGVRQL